MSSDIIIRCVVYIVNNVNNWDISKLVSLKLLS